MLNATEKQLFSTVATFLNIRFLQRLGNLHYSHAAGNHAVQKLPRIADQQIAVAMT